MSTLTQSPLKPAIAPEFRQLTRFICIGVLLIGTWDAFSGTFPSSLFPIDPTIRFMLFCLSIVCLLFLEWWLPNRVSETGNESSRYLSHAGYLTSLLVLTGLAVSIWEYRYTVLLFAVAILYSRLNFRAWVSYITIGISMLILFLRLAFGPRGNFISPNDMEVILTFGLIVVLVYLMSRLIEKEQIQRESLQQLNLELHQSHSQLQENADQLAELAVLSERNRLARDIHDGLGHHLTAVGIQLEIASQLQPRDPAASIEAIAEAKRAARDALADVRQSVQALRHANEPFDLKDAVDLLIQRISTDQLTISFKMEGDPSGYPQSLRLTLFRLIQEGLTNVYKHADASRANVWLQLMPSNSRLRIIDDGSGFDPAQVSDGNGLRGIRERIESLAGTITIDSRLGDGTVIDVMIPNG